MRGMGVVAVAVVQAGRVAIQVSHAPMQAMGVMGEWGVILPNLRLWQGHPLGGLAVGERGVATPMGAPIPEAKAD